jgi:hypothetical protein
MIYYLTELYMFFLHLGALTALFLFCFVFDFLNSTYVEQSLERCKLGLESLRITFTIQLCYIYRHLMLSTAVMGIYVL